MFSNKTQDKDKPKAYYPVFVSSNAITLSNDIQIIVRFFGEPDTIHSSFDFEHTKAYYDFHTHKLNIPKIVYECVLNKTLIYNSSKYPLCSLFRIRKFLDRGWTINAGQILKIALELNQINLLDINELENQLMGVDSAYFMSMINSIRRSLKEDANFKIDHLTIVNMVNKLF